MSRVKELEKFGQSVWLDYISRELLHSPRFKSLIERDGLKGMTSNPTIFGKAIAGSRDYDEELRSQACAGKQANEIYEALSLTDIRKAADMFAPVYQASNGRDGYVSYEVSPHIAHDTNATIAEAHRLNIAINRQNVMIKVPATVEGVAAIEELIARGCNINITLMFSMRHYDAVAEAYLRGIERRLQAGLPVKSIVSVASVFVSRIDTLVDRRIDELIKAGKGDALARLKGKGAVANAKLIYHRFRESFSGDRFRSLAQKGAGLQRLLWASTGTKNPAYSDILYVQELIGRDTVNTMPLATIDAFRDHGEPRADVEEGLEEARQVMNEFERAGIELDSVGEELLREGEQAFIKSFDDLMKIIDQRRRQVLAEAA